MTEESTKREVRICSVNDMKEAADLEPLWGNWVYRNSVILQAGTPGIRKTTFNFALAKHIAEDAKFLGIAPVEKGYNIFYFDPESHDSLIKARMSGIGWPNDRERFYVCNDSSITLPELEPYLEAIGYKPDIIFVDPIRVAFRSRDENDNAEGSKKATYLRNLARKYNCAVFAVHHSSKADVTGINKASGAGALSALADICMNFDGLGENSKGKPLYPTIFKLSIPKNRLIDDEFFEFIKAESKTFIITEPPDGYMEGEYEGATKRYTIQERVVQLFGIKNDWSPQELLESLDNCCTRQAIYKVLDNLITLGQAQKDGYGKYLKKQPKSGK